MNDEGILLGFWDWRSLGVSLWITYRKTEAWLEVEGMRLAFS